MKRIAQSYNKSQKNLLPLLSYIAKRRENELIDYLESKKIDTGTSSQDLVRAASLLLAKEQKRGNFKNTIKELYKIHPDKDAILLLFAEKQESFEGEEKPAKAENNSFAFLKTPLFRVLAVSLALIVLVIIISKTGD
jgi:hypothetical protein